MQFNIGLMRGFILDIYKSINVHEFYHLSYPNWIEVQALPQDFVIPCPSWYREITLRRVFSYIFMRFQQVPHNTDLSVSVQRLNFPVTLVTSTNKSAIIGTAYSRARSIRHPSLGHFLMLFTLMGIPRPSSVKLSSTASANPLTSGHSF